MGLAKIKEPVTLQHCLGTFTMKYSNPTTGLNDLKMTTFFLYLFQKPLTDYTIIHVYITVYKCTCIYLFHGTVNNDQYIKLVFWETIYSVVTLDTW